MAEQLIWIDREIRPASEFHIDPEDEGLLYGRGVFTTTRTFGNKPWLWDLHRQRLASSARAIGIPIDEAALPASEDVSKFVASLKSGDVVIRANVAAARTPSGRRIWMFARPLPEPRESLTLTVSPYRVSRADPLTSLKTFNYLARHLAFREAQEQGFDDAILLDLEGAVLETSHSNIFARFDEGWWTPPLKGGVLAGTVREVLCHHTQLFGSVASRITVDDLSHAREIVVTNSVHGVVPVQRIDRKAFEITEGARQLQQIVANTQR